MKISENIMAKAIDMYVNQLLTSDMISELVGISKCSILRGLRKNGYTVRTSGESQKGKKTPRKVSEKQTINLFKSGKSTVEIGKLLGCSNVTISNILESHNIPRRKNSFYITKKYDKELVKKLYNEGLSIKNISQQIKISFSVIRGFLAKHNLTRRAGSCSNKWSSSHREKYVKNRNYNKNNGLHDHIYLKKTGFTYADYMKQLPALKKYRNEVIRLSNRQPLKTLENYEKRGKSGTDGAYQLDHRFSVKMGFTLGVDPSIIAHISNLRMIPWRENVDKQAACSITLEELLAIQVCRLAA